MALDWDDLRVFLAVARGESLSAAAKVLGRDPATVGRRVGRLEQALGTALFVRTAQGYGLTEAGERLMRPAEEAEQAVKRGTGALGGAAGRLSGQIRIGAPDGCSSYLLPQVCAAIVAEHPELELQVVALPRVVNLSKREADLAVTVSPPLAGRLTVQKITDYHLHLVAARDWLEKNPDIKSVEDIAGHPIIGYIPDMIFDKELDYLAEIAAERVTLASNSVVVQLGFLSQGAGLGFVHDFSLPFFPHLVKVLPETIALTRTYYLVRHAGDVRNERVARVAEMVRSGLAAEVARLEAQSRAGAPAATA